jgi:hypothetical protein
MLPACHFTYANFVHVSFCIVVSTTRRSPTFHVAYSHLRLYRDSPSRWKIQARYSFGSVMYSIPCTSVNNAWISLGCRKYVLIHHHMALQPKSDPGLPCWGLVTITFLRGWIVSPAPNLNLEHQASVFLTPGDRVTQLYPQALGTHFSRLLRHGWVTVRLFFNPGHHTEYVLITFT